MAHYEPFMLNLSPIRLLISLGLGAWSGLLIAGYFLALEEIQKLHLFHTGLILLIPVFFLLNVLARRNSNYLPTRMKEIREANERDTVLWSIWTVPYNAVMSLFSHLAGGSVGRESTSVVIASGSLLWTKLNWSYWLPVAVSSSFAVATGSLLVAFVVCVELFFTKIEQKIYVLLSAWTGILVLKTLHVEPLIQPSLRQAENQGFFSALVFCLFLGLVSGYLARFYKMATNKLRMAFANFRNWKSISIGLLTSFVLVAGFIYLPLDSMKSLSTNEMTNIYNGQFGLDFPFLKIVLTLLFVAIGFIGGEFVPSVLIGMAIGVLSAKFLGESIQFGFAMGAFSFFAGLSKLKWTALALTFSYFGFENMLWALFAISVSTAFSEDEQIF